MTNKEVAEILRRIADMLEIKGEIVYKALAYRRAADNIEYLGRDIEDVWREGKLTEIPGVGKSLAEKLDELFRTGKMSYYEELKEEIPPGVVSLLQVPEVGPKTAKLVWEKLGITSIPELERAAREGKLRTLPGLGVKSEAKILAGIEALYRRSERIPLATALPVAREIIQAIMDATPHALKVTAAGSLRRMKATIGDIDILASSYRPEEVIETFTRLPHVAEVSMKGPTKSTVFLHNGLQVDLRVLPPERYGSLLQYFTGSKEHNVALRGIALEMGLSLSEYGFKRGEEEILCPEEEDVYRILGLEWIPPELRENRGEIEAAREKRLPRLIELGDIKGDLHVHTNWSDGASSIEEIAEAARRRGYQYLVISDHSHGLGIARGLSPEKLMEQRAIIQKLNERWNDFKLLQGAEVEIRADGSLDYPDEVLASLDLVIASIHTGLRQEKERITARVINAMRNPYVDIIGHPSGRILGQREESAVDMDEVLKVARETGTILEVDGTPDRLDLDDVYIRRAVEMGIKLAIDSDAHNLYGLDALEFGVAMARRGWAEPKDVVNTLPLEEFLRTLKRNRRH
ncbi:MAG: DNA polymerase/3'-5' exonuclease PolX [Anaerolineae bacterium]|nr:DNA polymerase/3'-5' exonuclease PolX [Anaerolineae bacterium]MDW8101358.1 DNA polymerase/3'-5' exonuclease PolX [Anaerolineae bacterium]